MLVARKYHAKLCYHRRRLMLDIFRLKDQFDVFDTQYLNKLLKAGYVRRTDINGMVIWSLSDKGREWCLEAQRLLDCKQLSG